MPECGNCGAHVSEDYVRVMSPNGQTVQVCPACPEKIRRNGRVATAKSPRNGARGLSDERLKGADSV